MRKAKNFKEVEQPVSLTVKTKCPDKWILIDRETGQTYVGNLMGHWDRLDSVIRDS
jgi:hypothetical protein